MAGKKMRAAAAKVEPRLYSLKDAVAIVKQTAYAKFDESVDLALRLGVDPKRSDQMVRGTTLLPHGSGKKVRVLVGKASFGEQQLYDNGHAIIESVLKARPASVKGRYLKSATISTTMGPGIRLDPVALSKQIEQKAA